MPIHISPSPIKQHYQDFEVFKWPSDLSWANKPRAIFPFLCFALIYIAIIAWFQDVDVYHNHFSDFGSLVFADNFCRLIYIFYLFWLVYFVGIVTLRFTCGAAISNEIAPLNRLLLGFFAGAGIWHWLMLLLGYLNLYRIPVFLAITLFLVVISYPHLRFTSRELSSALQSNIRSWDTGFRVGAGLLTLIALGFAGVLLIAKGLYPSGGHDYFHHYFPYYQTALRHHGLWPSDAWFHYYDSKGAGLFFLSMLLTNLLAPQLVTYCFVIAAALVLFALIAQIAPKTFWPWVGVMLYLALYIYTPGSGENMHHGGWGNFEKLHELNATVTIAIVWITSIATTPKTPCLRAWALGCSLAISAAIIIVPPIAVFWVGFFLLLAAWFFLCRQRQGSRLCVEFAIVAGCCFLLLLLLNYFTTGLVDLHGILYSWKFANVEQLNQWGVLPLVMWFHWGITGMAASARLFPNILPWLYNSLRLELLLPLILFGLITLLIVIAATILKKIRAGQIGHLPSQLPILAAFILAFIGYLLIFAKSSPISFYRFSTFVVPLIIASGIGLCVLIIPWFQSQTASFLLSRVTPVLILALTLFYAYQSYNPSNLSTILSNSWQFFKGSYSIDTAYTRQDGLPGSLPWGAIYPGVRGAWQAVGTNQRIWSLHIHSYCMVPDCVIETHNYFKMSPRWQQVMYGSAAEARKIFQEEGLNFFLISHELDITDPLPLSQLFAPDNIAQNLAVKWTDGTTYLLTWPGPDTIPLDTAWLEKYRQKVNSSPFIASFPYDNFKDILEQLEAMPHPWTSFALPWQKP